MQQTSRASDFYNPSTADDPSGEFPVSQKFVNAGFGDAGVCGGGPDVDAKTLVDWEDFSTGNFGTHSASTANCECCGSYSF
jgi:hypothetical protein